MLQCRYRSDCAVLQYCTAVAVAGTAVTVLYMLCRQPGLMSKEVVDYCSELAVLCCTLL